MSMSNFLYVRSLRKVDFTVFGVDTDQKKYFDKTFGVYLPYSSGQQCKRSFIDELLIVLDEVNAPIKYNQKLEKNGKISDGDITQPCDPTYVDQLLRGWMSKINDGLDRTEKEDKTIFKRRSPFSFSALTPIHPLLATLAEEKAVTFDRSESNSESIVVRNDKGTVLSEEEIQEFLEKNNKILTKRKYIPGTKNRANGFFKSDVAIDLRKLFRIPLIKNDVEVSNDTIKKMIDVGWIEVETKTGKFLELPKQFHESYAEAIAHSLINWRITSNQSRTFDTMPVLSIAISNRASEISNCIRGEIYDAGERKKANLVVDGNYVNTKMYSTKLLNGYVEGASTTHTAIDDAVKEIKERILEFYK